VVEGGRVLERPALSVVEPVDLPGVGRMEAGLTDGLRSLVRTLDVPEMAELTLRWPGHYELVRAFQATGLLSTDAVRVGDAHVRPLDLTTALLVEQWTYAEGEQDLTVMRVEVEGGGRRLGWDVLDRYDVATGTTSMARTTAFPCAIVARLLAQGGQVAPGVHPPEDLAAAPGLVQRVLAEHRRRGVEYRESAVAV
jgi:saccharopine dehydrogenase-like NADP-dependent oxidoreductase